MVTRIKLFLCELTTEKIDVRDTKICGLGRSHIGKSVWLDMEGVRQAGEYSGPVWKRNHKTGPKNATIHSNSKRAVILLKKSKICVWNSSHRKSYFIRGVQKDEEERLKEEHSERHEKK